jgi:putative SOS response-associated peptidase YedK
MCGRYAMAQSAEEIVAFFNLTENDSNPTLPLNWNIAPTNDIYIVKNRDRGSEDRKLETASWGLIAPWQKSFSEARAGQSHAINARSESIHEKPTFRDAFRTTRCLIPATGYYEWATSLGKYPPKQPFYITSGDGSPLSIAGIFSTWRSESGQEIQSASIITQEAVGELATIHSRMPVFMERDRWQEWLDPKNREIHLLQALMKSANPTAGLVTRPVSPRVNLVANNGPEIIAEYELGEPETLF